MTKKIIIGLLKLITCLLSFAMVVPILLSLLPSTSGNDAPWIAPNVSLMDALDAFVTQEMADAKQSVLSVRKQFWIEADAETLPLRDDSKYGTAKSPAELQWLLDDAAELLDGQETVFSTDIEIRSGTEITYYFDETILVITWQQILNRMNYTISEVKIAHPSQFRRHFADGNYNTQKYYPPAELAKQTGAVVASSADHYRGRPYGIVVYNGEVKRFTGSQTVDTCLIDGNADFILMPKGAFATQTRLEEYIEENGIQFSISFGPILIRDGQRCDPIRYGLGEINENYPRCAIAQKDELHYLLIVTNGNGSNRNYPTIAMFTDEIEKFNVRHAYCLDGGRTGSIVMQEQYMNPSEYKDGPRFLSDIIFFATALPNVQE